MRRLAAVAVLLLILAGLFVWYSRSRDSWYAGDYANGHLLRIAIRDDNPPFSFLDETGALAGFDVDIAQALCGKLQVKCRLISQGWTDNLITFLINGKYDVVVSSLPIAESEPGSVTFTDKYYSFPASFSCCGPGGASYPMSGGPWNAPWRFVARRAAANDISPAGLAGKRIGILTWPGFGDYVRDAYPGAVAVTFPSQAAANLALMSGRVDLLLADANGLSETFLNTESGAGFEFTGPVIADSRYRGSDAGIAVRREDIDLLRALNRALAAIRSDGTYKKINDRYFAFDVYGG